VDETQRSHPFIHHPDEVVQNYMQPIDRIILMSQDTNTLRKGSPIHRQKKLKHLVELDKQADRVFLPRQIYHQRGEAT
jgi:hypothetical protein